MQFIKSGGTPTLVLGPFLDDTDGKTPETGLTITASDVRLSKVGGAFAAKNEATSCSHMENGYYSCPLNTTDTNTVGRMLVAVNESGALPVWAEYMVVPANVYNSLFDTSDYLQVHTVEVTAGVISDDLAADFATLALAEDMATVGEVATEVIDTLKALVIDGTITWEQMQRIVLAFTAGKTQDAELLSPKFLGQDGTTVRIEATMDVNNNRTTVVLDGD